MSNEKRQAEMSAAAAERLRTDVQQLQRELFLAGEQQQRMHEKIQYMTLNHNRPEEFTSIKEAYHEELNSKICIKHKCTNLMLSIKFETLNTILSFTGLRQVLDSKNSSLEAAKARVAELESNATTVVHQMNEKKRQLKVVKDEYNDQLQVCLNFLRI